VPPQCGAGNGFIGAAELVGDSRGVVWAGSDRRFEQSPAQRIETASDFTSGMFQKATPPGDFIGGVFQKATPPGSKCCPRASDLFHRRVVERGYRLTADERSPRIICPTLDTSTPPASRWRGFLIAAHRSKKLRRRARNVPSSWHLAQVEVSFRGLLSASSISRRSRTISLEGTMLGESRSTASLFSSGNLACARLSTFR
jgi:hypothetical protein